MRKMEYPKDIPFKSIPDAFFKRARANSMRTFEIFKYRNSWFSRTFKESGRKILSIAGALRSIGVKKGDKVAIISQTRSEWLLSDLATQSCGAITVPIYPNISPETASFILKDSEAKVVFAEKPKNLEKLDLSGVKNVIIFEKDKEKESDDFILLDEFENKGENLHDKVSLENIGLDDIATIVYTSGTTGIPKGVILTHGNILSMVHSVSQIIQPKEDDVIFAWLPFAHIFGRLIIFYSAYNAVTLAYAESLAKIIENIKDVRPTLFPSVPRIYEKAYERIRASASSSPLKAKIFEFAQKIGEIYVEYLRNSEEPPPHILLLYKVADALVFSKIRELFGGRIRLCISGGAAIRPEIAKFFTAAGIKLLEGYGLTETASVVAVNRENKFKFGSFGLPIPYVDLKISPDGELLIKAPSVTPGYYKREEETRELFTEDGWMRTGDLVEMDEEGFLFFKGRKKNIIVTSFGKNIAPEPIEEEIKKDPLIDSVAIFGDERPYLVALITLNRQELLEFAKRNNIKGDVNALIKNEAVRKYVKEVIDRVNEKRPSYERIYKFEIVPDEWTAETGELTPTLKVKRYKIYNKYKDIIEKLYSG
ncbi:MAG: AMP-dependent synthetase/ligase [Candidatus Calescibacterium sp.]